MQIESSIGGQRTIQNKSHTVFFHCFQDNDIDLKLLTKGLSPVEDIIEVSIDCVHVTFFFLHFYERSYMPFQWGVEECRSSFLSTIFPKFLPFLTVIGFLQVHSEHMFGISMYLETTCFEKLSIKDIY